MQIILHPSTQRQGNGSSDAYTEPNITMSTLVIKVSQVSINLLGNITVKLQHSMDGSDWIDVPTATTPAIIATGTHSIEISPKVYLFDNLRLTWTFNNSNSITFYGAVLGTK